MAIIKRKDIYEGGKAFDELAKEIDALTMSVKNLQTQTREMNKSGSGAEAKQRLDLSRQLTAQTNKLVQAESAQAKELALLKVATQQANRERTEEAKISLKLSGEYAKQSKLLNDLRNRYKDLAVSEKGSTTEAKNLLTQITKLDTKLKQVDNSVGQNQRSVGKYGNALKGLGRQLLGAAGITAGFTLFVNVLKNAGKIVIDFEKSTSKLAAILQKSKKEISELTAQAKQLGSTTAFTASQVSDLQTELARLGFSIDEIKNSTPAILDLAAAFSLNLTDAASVSGGIVRAFGLSTKDTKEVVDSMTATLNNSGAAFEDYREAVKLSAPIFKAANIDYKTMNMLIGTLADSQIKGSLAGTGLKNLISKLSDENSKLSKELGFTVRNSDDLVKAFELLKTKNVDLTKATGLTDERSKAAFLTLISGVDSTNKLSNALNNLNDNAKKTAETMLDNLAGDITKAQSAWEGFILSVESGDGIISKAVRSIVQSFSSWLTDLTNLNKEHQSFEERLISWTGVFSALWPGLQGSVKKATAQFKELFGIGKEVEKQKVIGPFDVELMRKQARELQELILSGGKVEKTIEEINLDTKTNTELTAKQIAELKKLKAAEAELEAERQKRAAIKAEDEGISFEQLGMVEPTTAITIDPNAAKIAANEKLHNDLMISDEKYTETKNNIEIEGLIEHLELVEELKIENEEKAREAELERLYSWEDAKNDVREAAWATAEGLAMNANHAIANDTIESSKRRNSEEQALLKDKLQKGQITEAQYKKQSAAADKKARQEQAKAQRDAALFDIAISTAVGIIKALANTGLPAAAPLIVATIALGALNAALVLSQPLPKFAKGEVGIKGKSHAQGGKNINIEGGESIIKKDATSASSGLLNAINDGLISDTDLPGMVAKGLAFDKVGINDSQREGLIASLLMQGNKKADKMASALLNGVSEYTVGKIKYVSFADGSQRYTEILE